MDIVLEELDIGQPLEIKNELVDNVNVYEKVQESIRIIENRNAEKDCNRCNELEKWLTYCTEKKEGILLLLNLFGSKERRKANVNLNTFFSEEVKQRIFSFEFKDVSNLVKLHRLNIEIPDDFIVKEMMCFRKENWQKDFNGVKFPHEKLIRHLLSKAKDKLIPLLPLFLHSQNDILRELVMSEYDLKQSRYDHLIGQKFIDDRGWKNIVAFTVTEVKNDRVVIGKALDGKDVKISCCFVDQLKRTDTFFRELEEEIKELKTTGRNHFSRMFRSSFKVFDSKGNEISNFNARDYIKNFTVKNIDREKGIIYLANGKYEVHLFGV